MDYGPLLKEKPVVMDDNSVRAMFYGWKTEDRRPIKLEPGEVVVRESRTGEMYAAPPRVPKEERKEGASVAPRKLKPAYNLGEILWVREAAVWGENFAKYRVDFPYEKAAWQAPIFLPKKLCRLFLQVTSVRAQRLHEVTPDEAMREGVVQFPSSMSTTMLEAYQRAAYTALPIRWNELHGAQSPWESNPWVWAITFRLLGGSDGNVGA